MFGELSEEESRNFLDENIYGRLGCHAFGKTYVVPISYAHKAGSLYCHSFDGLKLQMMRNNPSVCFQVDVLDNMANWKSVITQGVFEELTGQQKNKGLRVLLERKVPAIVSETVRLSPEWPFPSEDYARIPGIVFRIQIKEISGRYEKSDAVTR